MLGKSPKLGQQPKFGWANFFQILAGPIFSTLWLGQNLAGPIMAGPLFWLGQFFPLFGWAKVWLLAQFWLGQVAGPYFGWANFAGQVLWLGHFGWANGWVIDWPSQKFGPAIIGPAKFFFTLAGTIMAQPKIWPSHNWPSQFF